MEQLQRLIENGPDSRYSPFHKLPATIPLPHGLDNWPIVKILLTKLGGGEVLEPSGAIGMITKIAGVVNKAQSVSLHGLECFMAFLKKRSSHPKKFEDVEKAIFAINDKEWVGKLLPFIAQTALQIEELFPEKEIKLLRSGEQVGLTLSKKQTACLLANMFLCTIQDREPSRHLPEACSFFYLHGVKHEPDSLFTGKFLCLTNYFLRAQEGRWSSEPITFERIVLSKQEYEDNGSVEAWINDESPLVPVDYHAAGKIEEVAPEKSIQVDFANQYLGGGALLYGCVQEEIMFVLQPELLVGCLFCGRMAANQAILITGTEWFSSYSGYAQSFSFKNDYEEKRTVQRQITAIDALMFLGPGAVSYQLDQPAVMRELNKAWVGFRGSSEEAKEESKRAIVTGKWGCGAFRGDAQLKFVIQWLAASRCGRAMQFCGFGDPQLELADKMVERMRKETGTVGGLFKRVFAFTEKKNIEARLFEALLSDS